MTEQNNGSTALLEKLRNILNKTLIPGLLIILGAILLIKASNPVELKINEGEYQDISQTPAFLWAGIGLLLVGAVIGLFNLGILNAKVIWAIGLVALIGAGIFMWQSYQSVATYKAHKEMKERVDNETKQRLVDARAAMKAFIDVKGRAAENWDELEDFVRNGVTYEIQQMGTLPYRDFTREELDYLGFDKSVALDQVKWTDARAAKLATMPNPAVDIAGFRRDTTEVPILDKLFTSDKARSKRARSLATFPFELDSMRYVPFKRKGQRDEFAIEYKLDPKPLDGGGIDSTYLFRIYEPNPIPAHPGDKIVNDTLSVGSLTTTSTKGSWEK